MSEESKLPQPWTEATSETVRTLWTDLLLRLVQSYHGKRMTMWSRLPDMMVLQARTTGSLDRWYTQTLRSLQIDSQGSASEEGSLCSTWATRRAALRALPAASVEEAERRALRLLQDERATITAMAQLRWDTIKVTRAAQRAAGAPTGGEA